MQDNSLKNKNILVIGAGGLIGKEIIKNLRNSEANVIAVDYSKESIETLKSNTNDNNIYFLEADITKESSIENLFIKIRSEFQALHGAVNTAYPRNSNYGKDFLEVSYDDFTKNLALHLGGYFLFMQQCLKYSIEYSQDFSLVNLSSIYGTIAPKFSIYENTKMTMPVEYAAIKSALQHLTAYTTAYTKAYNDRSNFRVNCVSPGGILDNQPSAFLEKYNNHCLTKGMLNPEDITDTINFLLSEKSKYISGQNIIVDDGFCI